MASAPEPITAPKPSNITINPDEHIYFTLLASKSPEKFTKQSFPATFGPEQLTETTTTPTTPQNDEYLMLDLAIMKDNTYYELTDKVKQYKSKDSREKLKLFLEWILPGRYWRCAALLRNGGPTNTSEHEALQRQMIEIQDQVTLIEKALTAPAPTAPAPAPAPAPPTTSEKWAIMLDFDGTIAAGHSGGTFDEKQGRHNPMDDDNKTIFKKFVTDMIDEGHSIAIITRAIDTKIASYLNGILNPPITITPKKYVPGNISLYAPTETEFNADHGDDEPAKTFWAGWKVEQAVKFLTECKFKNVIFMDDTEINVTKMEEQLKIKQTELNLTQIISKWADPGKTTTPYIATFLFIRDKVKPKPPT